MVRRYNPGRVGAVSGDVNVGAVGDCPIAVYADSMARFRADPNAARRAADAAIAIAMERAAGRQARRASARESASRRVLTMQADFPLPRYGAVSGNLPCAVRGGHHGIVYSDPAGIFGFLGGIVEQGANVAGQAVSAATQATQAAAQAAAQAADQARRAAEEQARRVAEQAAAAARQAADAAAAAKRAAEEQARRVAEQAAAAKRAAEEQARRVAEQAAAAKRAAEEQARKVAEQAAAAARRAAEEQARRVAEQAAAAARAVEQATASTRAAAEEQAVRLAEQAAAAAAAAGSGLSIDFSRGGAGIGFSDGPVVRPEQPGQPGLSVDFGMGGAGADILGGVTAVGAAMLGVTQDDRDRIARELAQQIAAVEAAAKPILGAAQGVVSDLYQTEIVKGVGDVVANVPAQVFSEVTTELGAGISGLMTGVQVSEADKQRYKDLQQVHIADSIYNMYATPGQLVDFATSTIDLADEVFFSGDYERTHYGDAIKKDIFRRDEISPDVPGSLLGYGSQYDRDRSTSQLIDEYSEDNLLPGLALGYADWWTDYPIVEGLSWGAGKLVGLGKSAIPLATAISVEQIADVLGELFFWGDDGNLYQMDPVVGPGPGEGSPGPVSFTVDPVGATVNYDAQLAEARRQIDERYDLDMAEYDRQMAAYQAQIDDAYVQQLALMEIEYSAAIASATGSVDEYDAAIREYAAAQSELDAEYYAAQQAMEDEYYAAQRAMEDQYLREQEEYARQLEEYNQQVADYEQALLDESARMQAEYAAAIAEVGYGGGVSTVLPSGGALQGSVSGTPYPGYDPYETMYVVDEETGAVTEIVSREDRGVSPMLVAGVAGAALIAGAYYLSTQKLAAGHTATPRRV